MADSEQEAARQRIWQEPITGSETRFPDGTLVRGQKVLESGPRAIVGKNGEFLGLRPE